MVSSTAANSLNQPTPQVRIPCYKVSAENGSCVTWWGTVPLVPLEAQSLVNPGRTQPLLGRDSQQEPPKFCT